MTISRLPIDSVDPHSSFSVELDGSSYVIEFDWNARDGAWYASAFADDAEQTPIVEGWRVCAPGRLFGRAIGDARPPGDIIFAPLDGAHVDPGRNDLGVRVIALYYDAASLAEVLAELEA